MSKDNKPKAGDLHPYQYKLLAKMTDAILNGKKLYISCPPRAGRTTTRRLLKERFPYLYNKPE